jgi:adenylyltransferase/sulfurtransferase
MMGVKRIVIIDRDTVEVSNLSRSVFFREADHGSPKADVLCDRLRELNPDVDVIGISGDVDGALGLGVVRRMDMIFSCLDNRMARRSLNRMCQKMAKSWVDGSMENLLGDVTAFLPDQGPCYECLMTQNDKEITAKAFSCTGVALRNLSVGRVPTTSTMGSIIAGLQVQEALKLLHGDAKGSLAGSRLVVNCEINDFYRTSAERKEECEGHFRYGEVTEVPEWRSDSITPLDILERYEADTGTKGHLRLGREIVVTMHCPVCNTEAVSGEPLRLVSLEKSLCPSCNTARDLKTTNVVAGSEAYARETLKQLGTPLLDIIEARGHGGSVWYEITGDAETLLWESVGG